MKKNILFIVDKPNWAYEFMVMSWIPYLVKDYDCYIAYQNDYAIKQNTTHFGVRKFLYNTISNFRKSILRSKKIFKISDNDNFFYPIYLKPIVYKIDKKLNKKSSNLLKFDTIVEMAFYFQYTSLFPFKANKKNVGIFTDKFPHDGPVYDVKNKIDRSNYAREKFYNEYLSKYDHIIVGGGNLLRDYRKLTPNVDFVYGIFGEENFKENKQVGTKTGLTIGWTGTPDRPMKGFRTIIEPAIDNVRKTGREINLKTKFSGPYEDLYHFYEDVDCVVIASDADSGPSLYAEACLSSVPCISTKVGLPLTFLQDNINGLFIERTIESLENSIIELYDNREKLQSFSKRVKEDYLEVMSNDKIVNYIKKVI